MFAAIVNNDITTVRSLVAAHERDRREREERLVEMKRSMLDAARARAQAQSSSSPLSSPQSSSSPLSSSPSSSPPPQLSFIETRLIKSQADALAADGGAPPLDDATSGDWQRKSALHLAAQHDRVEIVRLLLDTYGAPLADARTRHGETPLMAACEAGAAATLVELLTHVRAPVDRRGHINATDKRGWSALMSACAHSHTECVRTLLRLGAPELDASLINDDGASALLIARAHNAAECAALVDAHLRAERTTRKTLEREHTLSRLRRFFTLDSIVRRRDAADAASGAATERTHHHRRRRAVTTAKASVSYE